MAKIRHRTMLVLAGMTLAFMLTGLQPIAAQSVSPTTASQPAATQPITADELVGQYKTTCDSVHSFIIKTRCVTQGNQKLTGKRSAASGYVKREGLNEMRYDGGKRLAFRTTEWGNRSLVPTKVIPKEHPQYTSYLAQGNRFISYLYTEGLPPHLRQGSVIISGADTSQQQRKLILTASEDSPLLGYLKSDKVRLDENLTHATSLSLRPTQEVVGGSRCFVVDAVTKYGKYTVWIDPDHGYNLARAQVVKSKGDIIQQITLDDTIDRPLPQGHRMSMILQVVRFGKVGQTWVPMEADITTVTRGPNEDVQDIKTHVTRTEVTLNPDWTATKAFDPDDIRDGAKVNFLPEFTNTRCFWQGGKVLLDPREGDLAEADPELQKLIADFNAQVASQPTTASRK